MLKKLITIFINFIKNKLLSDFVRFVKYCLVGLVGALIDILILYFLVKYANLNYFLAGSISFVLAVINNYCLNKFWTFRNKGKKYFRQFSSYLLIAIAGLILNIGIMYFGVEFLAINYLTAKALAIIIVTFWNFLMNKFWTFKIV